MGKIKIAFLTKQRNDAVRIVEDHMLFYFQKNPKLQITVFRFPFFFNHLANILFLPFCFFSLINIYRKSDIVHYSSPQNYFIVFHPLLKKILGTQSYINFQFLEKQKYWNSLFKFLLPYFDVYFCISSFVKKRLNKIYKINKKKIKIYYGAPSRVFYHQNNKQLKKLNYLLYIGDEYPRKNLKTLFETFKLLNNAYPELKLIKIGKTKIKRHQKQTDKILNKLQLKNLILKRKNIPLKSLRKYYSNAQAFILTSSEEGFSIPTLEAMRCSCIPLVSNISSFKAFKLPQFCLINKFDKPQAWFQRIEKLINMSNKKKKQLQKTLYQKSLDFSWEKSTSIIEKFYLK